LLAAVLCTANASAQVQPSDMPGTEGAVPGGPDAAIVEEPVIEISVGSQQMPVLVIAPATASDGKLAEDVAGELQLTGLFDVRTTTAMKLGPGLPARDKWPGLTTAAVVVARSPRESTFPLVTSEAHHAAEKDVYRRRELVEYPGSEPMVVPVLADSIIEDVLGVRSHMSGQLLMTDASTRGERSVRVSSPDGKRGRRVSGFGSLSRGAGFDKDGRVWYAAEDASGKLQVFRERETTPLELGMAGYVQSVAFSPTASHLVVSIGDGNRVRTWLGTSVDSLQEMQLPQDRTSLSPSVDASGRVVHTVGPIKGPFSVFLGAKQVTAPGVWAAMPSFCSTLVEDRVVFMVRAGRSWHVRIKSLTNEATRTVATHAMSPTCSPDGRTVAFFSPDKYGKGPGIYLVSDIGGRARKVWDGQAAGLRWRAGEPLPRKAVVRAAPPQPETPPQPTEPQPPQ
jgi:TolB protein